MTTAAPTTPEVPFAQLSDEIKPHVHTLRALTIAHNLIMESSFPLAKVQDAYQSCEFLRNICQQAMTVALGVNGWEQVRELVAFKAQLDAQAAAKVPAPEAPEAPVAAAVMEQAPIGDEQQGQV